MGDKKDGAGDYVRHPNETLEEVFERREFVYRNERKVSSAPTPPIKPLSIHIPQINSEMVICTRCNNKYHIKNDVCLHCKYMEGK